MKELSPIDSKLIEQFTNAIRKFRGQNVFEWDWRNIQNAAVDGFPYEICQRST